MSKAALVMSVPVLGLGLLLSQMTPAQRAEVLASAESFLGFTRPTAPAATTRVSLPAATLPHEPVPAGSTAVEANGLGQYETTMEISGRSLPALVDTGASYVSLTFDDAASIGLHPGAADFRYTLKTANGIARAAGAVVPVIRVGNVEAYDVQVVISEAGALTAHSLLGMSFLRKLSGFQVQSGRLLLKQ